MIRVFLSSLSRQTQNTSPVATRPQPPASAALPRRLRLRPAPQLNNGLAQLAARVEAVRATMLRLLESEEDLAGLYLTEKAQSGVEWWHTKRRNTEEPLEVEILLETFYRQVEEVAVGVESMRNSIKFTDNYVKTVLDASRNALIRLDVTLRRGAPARVGGLQRGLGTRSRGGPRLRPAAWSCAGCERASPAVQHGHIQPHVRLHVRCFFWHELAQRVGGAPSRALAMLPHPLPRLCVRMCKSPY